MQNVKFKIIAWYRKVYSIYHCENCTARLLPKAIFLPASVIAMFLLGSLEPLLAQDPGPETFEPVYATVLKDGVNIRAGQGVNFEVLGQLNKGKSVAVFGQEYGWYKIKLPAEAKSYVHKDYIDAGIINVNKLRVRAGSRSNFNVLGILRKGQRVNVREETGDWLRIAPPDNCKGWIKEEYLELSNRKFKRKRTKSIAQQFTSAKAKKKKIEAFGVIDDLGKIYNRPGTHKLIKGKKILYYLKSAKINLNRYVYRKVRVIGELLDLEHSAYPVINVEQVKTKQ